MAEKLYYKIGEVAAMLGEEVSTIRFWSDTFPRYVKPERNAKGNRLFHPEDVETLQQVQFLLKKQGMTLDGAAARLSEDRRSVEKRVKALNSLKEIRAQLVEVRKAL